MGDEAKGPVEDGLDVFGGCGRELVKHDRGDERAQGERDVERHLHHEAIHGHAEGEVQNVRQGDSRPPAVQGTFREHSGNIQGTFREHSGNIQGELSGRP